MLLSDRIARAMAATPGLSAAGLARACGIARSSVHAWVHGPTQSIDGKYLTTAAAYLRVDPHWLSTGKGDMKAGAGQASPGLSNVIPLTQSKENVTNVEPAPSLRVPRRVPVVGEVKGGDDGYLDELQYPVGHGDGFVDYPASDPQAYALRVRGDSMYPRYKAGEFIVVEPGLEAQPGDDVVVALTDGRKLLKELNWIRDGEIQLLSSNNHFGPLTLQLSDVLYVQLVSGRARRSSFHKT